MFLCVLNILCLSLAPCLHCFSISHVWKSTWCPTMKFLNMSAELCSQLFCGCFPIPVQSSFENWQLKNRKLAKQQQIGVRSTWGTSALQCFKDNAAGLEEVVCQSCCRAQQMSSRIVLFEWIQHSKSCCLFFCCGVIEKYILQVSEGESTQVWKRTLQVEKVFKMWDLHPNFCSSVVRIHHF